MSRTRSWTAHLLCMAHAWAKFVDAANHGEDADASEFVEKVDELFSLESHYRTCGYGPDRIRQEREGEETEAVVSWLRRRLDELLSEENPRRSEYMDRALAYLDKFWEGLSDTEATAAIRWTTICAAVNPTVLYEAEDVAVFQQR